MADNNEKILALLFVLSCLV